MNIQKIMLVVSVVVIAFGAGLLLRHRERLDLEAQVAGLTYTLQCTEDGTEVTWSTEKMNAEIAAGRTVAPEAPQRRFTCPSCNTTSLVLKEKRYE